MEVILVVIQCTPVIGCLLFTIQYVMILYYDFDYGMKYAIIKPINFGKKYKDIPEW